MANKNSNPVPYKDQHDSKQGDKLRQFESGIARLDKQAGPGKGGRN